MQSTIDEFAGYFGMSPATLEAYLDAGITNFGGFDVSQFIILDNPYKAIIRSEKPLNKYARMIPGFNDSYPRYFFDDYFYLFYLFYFVICYYIFIYLIYLVIILYILLFLFDSIKLHCCH
jgi:hypothetical protein